MSKWSEFKLSVTPQKHFTQAQTASQIINIPGDVGYMTEYFVERNHQDGIILDYKFQNKTKIIPLR